MKTKKNGGVHSVARQKKPEKKEEDDKLWKTESLPLTPTQTQTQTSTTQTQDDPDDNEKEDEEGKISFYVKVGKHWKLKH